MPTKSREYTNFNLHEQIFEWTIISNKLKKESSSHYFYVAKCSCGTERLIRSVQLKSLKTTGIETRTLKKKCGNCIAKENKESKSEHTKIASLFKYVTNKTQARKEGKIDFNLSIEEYSKIIKENCIYCGMKPNNKFRFKHKSGDDYLLYQGVDRIDSNGNYTINNVVPCCDICNKGKHVRKVEEFQEYLNNIALFNQGSTARERIDKYLLTSIVASSEAKWEGSDSSK